MMNRTISIMVGKGSVNHNSRKFHAKNTDPERSHLNVEYCNENLQSVYHQLFDEAQQRYNAKQKRADRMIPDYYEKIRSGKQEKLFHEVIVQIGNREDMNAQSENGALAAQVLDEYMREFQKRNPNLRVFSAHLHMDEATPHLHIDFVPFTTGSKRGMDTRVSLKKALAAQGYTGGSRSDTEWNQWVEAEKNALAAVMERHEIQWEKKGTHEKHLSVLDFEKRERAKEVAALESQKTELQERVDNLQEACTQQSEQVEQVEKTLQALRDQQLSVEQVEAVEAKPVPLTGKVMISKQDYETLTTAAQKYVVQEKQESKLKKRLKDAKKIIADLKAKIESLAAELSAVKTELVQYKSPCGQLRTSDLEQENDRLRSRLRTYEDVISCNNLWHFFHGSRGKKRSRDDTR